MTTIRYYQASCHIKRCCLTGTIRAKQSDYLALLHVERHIIYHGTLAIDLHQMLCSKYQTFLFLLLYLVLILHLTIHFSLFTFH